MRLRASTYVLGLALALLALGCGGGSSSADEDGRGGDVLRVGYIPITGMASLWAAMDQGYFEEVGITIKSVDLPGGPELFTALEGGSVDVAWAGYTTFFVAVAQGFDFSIVAGSISENAEAAGDGFSRNGLNGILVKADSGIRTANDLNGKRIAANTLNSFVQLYTMNWMALHGADPKASSHVAVPYPEMGTALRDGRVDAVSLSEPFLTTELQKGGVSEIGTPLGDASLHLPTSGWYAKRSFAERNSDLVQRFVQALRKGAQFVNGADAEARAKIVAAHSQTPVEVLRSVRWWSYDEGPVDPAALQREADRAVEFGLMDKKIAVKDAIFATALE